MSVLPVGPRRLADISGVPYRGGAGVVEALLNRPPNENVLLAARRAPASAGGAGISCILECGEAGSLGGGISVEDGRVDDELSRVEVELT